MKKEIKDIIILEDHKESYSKEFELEKDRFSKKIYVSYYEEKARIASIICKKKINCKIDNCRELVLTRLVKQLHPGLELADLLEGGFYRTAGKSGKNVFKVTELKENQIDIEWFNKDQNFIKSFRIIPSYINKNKTVIRYLSYVKGMKSIESNFEKRIRSVFLRREKIAFDMEVINIKLELKLIKKNKENFYKKKLDRMYKYSKSLY